MLYECEALIHREVFAVCILVQHCLNSCKMALEQSMNVLTNTEINWSCICQYIIILVDYDETIWYDLLWAGTHSICERASSGIYKYHKTFRPYVLL